VASVKKTGEPVYIADVGSSKLKRRELAIKCGISEVAFVPFEDGVLEIGNVASSPQWGTIPDAPVLPKKDLRRAFEELGALYALFWQPSENGEQLNVIADYENPTDVKRRLAIRGDGESFTKVSRALTLDAKGQGPVAKALNTKEEVVVTFAEGCQWSADQSVCSSMKRTENAVEYDIGSIHFVPVLDEKTGVSRGVMEFGVSTTSQLNQITTQATLKMQTDGSGAGYAIYWKQNGQTAAIESSYVSAALRKEMSSMGKSLSFAEVSESTSFEVLGASPVAQVMRTRQPLYVEDMAVCSNDLRAPLAAEYSITSVAFVPVLGGVIEYGTTKGGNAWSSQADALKQAIPNEELDAAFAAGATYAIFWERNDKAGVFTQKASFELPKNSLSKSIQAGNSYIKESGAATLNINGQGPIALCSSSAQTIVVGDTLTFPNFKRRELAQEWGVGKITCVPMETGVLEFGTVTKDKRETTKGSEFTEANRPYRRSVFMHGEWVKHRSTEKFFDTVTSLAQSGVIRARYNEVAYVVAFSSFLVVYNAIAGGYTDFEMVKQPPIIPHLPVFGVPLTLFQLTAPSLGLLLVFKTNAAYGRWDNARKVWGSIINKTRSLVRQGNTFFTDDRYPGYGNFRDYRRRVAGETSAFTRCLRCFLRGAEDVENLRVELKALGFTPSEVAGYMKATNRQVYALQKISETCRIYGMDGRDRSRMDQTLSDLCDDVGACERIFKTPIPLVYTRHTARFVGAWLALLPLGIYSVDTSWNHLVSIPACALTVFFLLGIEELGMQIEEPFGILPMEAFCEGSIYGALNEMVLSEDGKRKQVPNAVPAAAPTIAEMAAATVATEARVAAEAAAAAAAAAAIAAAKAAEPPLEKGEPALDVDEKPGKAVPSWVARLVK